MWDILRSPTNKIPHDLCKDMNWISRRTFVQKNGFRNECSFAAETFWGWLFLILPLTFSQKCKYMQENMFSPPDGASFWNWPKRLQESAKEKNLPHIFYPNLPIFLHRYICHICDISQPWGKSLNIYCKLKGKMWKFMTRFYDAK